MWSKGASHFEFFWTSIEAEITTWSEFLKGAKATLEQTQGLGEINKFKRARFWESQSGFWVGKLTIQVNLWEMEML